MAKVLYKKYEQTLAISQVGFKQYFTLNENLLVQQISRENKISLLNKDLFLKDVGISGNILGLTKDNFSLVHYENNGELLSYKLLILENKEVFKLRENFRYFSTKYLILWESKYDEDTNKLINFYTFYNSNYIEMKKYRSENNLYFYDSFNIKISDEIIVYREGRILAFGTKIVFLNASDFSENFSFDINILKEFVPLWQEEPVNPYCDGDSFGDLAISSRYLLVFENTAVFTVGSRKFAEEHHRIIGIDIRDGSLKYVSDLVNPNQIYEYENKLYCKNSRIVYQIDPHTGIVIKSYDFNEVCIKHSVEDHPYYKFYDHDFFIGDGVLILGEYRKYNFIVLELETGKVLLHYKFKMGVEVPKNVHRMSLPIYHNGKVYINSGNFDLFIFDLKRD
jgi:outer membrane protein assembly factor BamB